MKGICILGATGSIGKSTLEVLALHQDQFHVVAVTANRNVKRMAELCRACKPSYAVMADPEAARQLADALSGMQITIWSGSDALEEVAVLEEVDVIWRVPPVIPFEVLVIARDLPPEISQSIRDALFRITGMQAGRQVLRQAYGIDEWERITDTFYEEFRLYLDASGVDLESILNQ